MIKIENVEVHGFQPAIRGMRNPKNSWDRSDSYWHDIKDYNDCDPGEQFREYRIGENDYSLMMRLAKAGPEHAKYRRMIVVYVDITAPMYWWKEFDTYKVGTVANSCSTMHKIAEKEFTLEDFSHEHLNSWSMFYLKEAVHALNINREIYIDSKDKELWWQMIQLLPSSYNQRRTVMLNYETLANIYRQRQGHKLDEWREFCQWIKTILYSEIITNEQ